MENISLTLDEMKMLAEVERNMDNGSQPFVLCASRRWAFDSELLSDCNIISGQTVTDIMLINLIEMRVSRLRTEIQINEILSSTKT